MDFKVLAEELNTYVTDKYKAFTDRFTVKKWSDNESCWILSKNDLCLSEIEISFSVDDVTISLAIWNDNAFEEIKIHSDYIKNNYGLQIGCNQEKVCVLGKEVAWNNPDSKRDAFDWIIMNSQLFQDIVDRYLDAFEEKELQHRQKIRDFVARRNNKADANSNNDYETRKVFAETNNRTGVRYKIIHRKSQDRHEIWTYDHGKRNRINNSEVERIKQDKDAMIRYVKDNLLK